MPRRLPPKIAATRGTERRASRVKPGVGASPASAGVPKPPRDVKGVERRVWLELAAQVELVGSYNPAALTAFRMAVKTIAALEVVDPAKTKPTAYAQLQRAANGWLSKFGLTPADRGAAPAPGGAAAPDRFGQGPDPVEAFLFGGKPKLEVVQGGKGGAR